MKRFAVLALGTTLLMTPLTTQAEEQLRTVTVTGLGQVSASPDMAVLRVGAAERSSSAEDALQDVAKITGSIITALGDAGIAPTDVQTESFNLIALDNRREQNANPSLPSEYEASTLLSVRVRDVGTLGDLVDSLSKAGANEFRGVTFGIDEGGPLRAKARELAVKDALLKAGQLVSAAGVSLGSVLSISDGSGGGVSPQARMAVMSDAMPIASGEVSLTERVTVVIELAD